MHPNVVETIECDHDFGFALKIKNPFFKFYTLNAREYLSVPILTKVDKKSNIHFDGTILILQEIGRYFHDFLELFPKIVSLKNNNKKFKLILNSSHENTTEDKIFFNMLREYDYLSEELSGGPYSFAYLLDFLKKYNIDFECHNFDSGSEISADYAYIFYAKFKPGGYFLNQDEIGKVIAEKEIDFLNHDEYKQTYSLFPGIDDPAINILRDFFPKYSIVKNKKVFIGRRPGKWFDRQLKNYEIVEKYFKDLNYEIINLEDLNLFDQIKNIQEAEFIVSFMGSSLLNTLLCNEENNVLILNALPYNSQLVFLRCLDEAGVNIKNIYCGEDGKDIVQYIDKSKSKFINLFK